MSSEKRGRDKIPQEDLLDEIRRLDSVVDGVPTTSDMRDKGEYSYYTYITRFGSWKDSLTQAGVDVSDYNGNRGGTREKIPESDLLEEIRRVSDELGRVPKCSEMGSVGEYSCQIYTKRFGSWNNALTKSGIAVRERHQRPKQISDEDILIDICIGYEALGEWPTSVEYQMYGEYTQAPAYDRWGSWEDTIERAEEFVRENRELFEESIVREVTQDAE